MRERMTFSTRNCRVRLAVTVASKGVAYLGIGAMDGECAADGRVGHFVLEVSVTDGSSVSRRTVTTVAVTVELRTHRDKQPNKGK